MGPDFGARHRIDALLAAPAAGALDPQTGTLVLTPMFEHDPTE